MSQKRIKVRPGRTQSKLGFFVGIAFCIIGCVVVIPVAGLFGVLWTGIAVAITVINYKNAFSEEGVSTHEIIIDESENGSEWNRYTDGDSGRGESSGEDIEAKFKKLNSLYEQGLITASEFEAKRKELLDRF
ncbi:MAG: SHOCT domain-containing protein [Lachnospiraceae bacterium]|nr:SHOCT domain-containing protein [Lachnospiraceae bacterium]